MPKWVAEQKAKKKKDEQAKKLAQNVVNKTTTVAKKTSSAITKKAEPKKVVKPSSVVQKPATKATTVQRITDTATKYSQPKTTKTTTQKTNSRLTAAQKIKSGDYSGVKDNAINRWDRDIADTVKSTLKQTAAEEGRFINTSMRGITLKDRQQYATQDQIKKADEKVAKRDEEFRKKIKQESAEMEKLKQGHSYLGQQVLSAVSSTTGMATDMAWGPASLAHMFMRTTAGSMGDVKEKAEPLKQKLAASGNYSQEEIDEMFKDVDKWDYANALFQGGIEVFSEKMFGGFGIAKRVGGTGVLDKTFANLGARMGSKASSGILGNILKGTAEEVAEEEIGNPLQTLASNLIYGNRLQNINEDATRRELLAQSNAIRSNIRTPEDAQAIASQLNSKAFIDDGKNVYLEAGFSEKESEELAEMARDYLTAAVTGDTEKMQELQNEMVEKLAGGENGYKEKWTLQDAIDAAVSTSLMTVATGAPGSISTSRVGEAYKTTNGMDAVKNLAQITKNLDPEKSVKAQAIIDRIDSGNDVSGTQVYELIQWSSEAATASYQRQDAKERMADREMKRENLFVAPATRNEDGSVSLGELTDTRYDEKYNEVLSKAKSSLKDVEVEDLEVAADVTTAYLMGTITANQMNELSIDNASARAVFQDATGINLDQFNEYDSKGNLNVAESNIAMQEALFAKAADNYVESARLEQNNWNDGARGEVASSVTEGLGSNGDVAVHDALNAVDPRDRSTFILMGRAAQNIYEYGRYSNESWDSLKGMYPSLPQDALRDVYESAKADKAIAETPYYNAIVKSGQPTNQMDMSEAEQTEYGKFTNEAERQLRDSEQVILQSLARQFNINIKLLPSKDFKIKSKDDNKVSYSNGSYDPKTGTMYLNGGNDMERNIIAVALHEITHHIAIYAPDEYLVLSNEVMDRWYKNDADAFKAAIKRKQDAYKKAVGQNLTEEQALEEVIADAIGEMNEDAEFIDQICRENPTLADRIIEAIKDVLRKLRQILSSGRVAEEYEDAFFSQLEMWDDAQRLWMNAAKVAKQNRAEALVNEWQDNVNAESRQSVKESRSASAKYERGEKLTHKQFNSFYSAHKLNYGAAQKGDLAETIDNIKANGFTSNTALSNVVPAGINDFTDVENPNYTQGLYGAREGDTVLLVPRTYLDERNDRVKNGFVPRDYEVVTVERDFQPYYELYSKAYDANNQTRYSLSPVEPVQPSSDSWKSGATFAEVKAAHPTLFEQDTDQAEQSDENDKRHLTQVKNTVSTYNKIYDMLGEDFKGTILDASSGLGEGTRSGRENYGFDVDDIEPYPDKNYKPRYMDYSTLNKQYDVVISNAVLNVLTQDDRDAMVNHIGELLKPGGRAFINVRGSDVLNAKNKIAIDESNMEYFIPKTSKSGYYQKGFTPKELKAYLEDALGDGFTVENTTKFGKSAAIVTKNADAQIRFSISDADYMSAVESGDMETAQRMVDEAAAEAMPNTKLTGRWYHGTENEFTEFNFSQGGKNGHADGYGIYLTNDPEVAKSYGNRMIEGYVNVERPASALTTATLTKPELHRLIERTVDVEAETLQYDGYDSISQAKFDTWISNYTDTYYAGTIDKAIDEVIDNIMGINGNDYDIILEIMTGMGIRSYDEASDFYEILTEETGIDGFETKWGDESEMADPNTPTIALAFRSSQIKDASPVTYDDNGNVIPLSERFNQESPDIRYSITPEMDADYMAAVNSGNMEEAQRLVGEAASVAGYGTRLYHGTRTFGFTQIRTSELESKSDGGYYDWSPFFASDSLEVAQTYSSEDDVKRISEANEPFDEDLFDDEYHDSVDSLINSINEFAGIYNYMDYSVNPFLSAYKELQTTSHPVNDITEELIDNVTDIISEIAWSRAVDYVEAHPEENISEDAYADELQESIETNSIWVNVDIVNDMLRAYDEGVYGSSSSGNYELLTNTDNMMTVDAKGHRWNDIPFDEIPEKRGYYRTRQLAEIARDEGYDGIQISNLFDDGGHGKGKRQKNPATIYIFFKPERQVKSADTVTYAEDGSVIPLSERFDPTNDDIRYSLPTQDSDGKILTDGQMEYFRNSQARDEQGRLMPVYHGTFRGPRITIFDDSRDGIWFTSSRGIADDYSMGYEMGEIGVLVGRERNPYDTDDEYFEKQGFIFTEVENGEWKASRVDERTGREFTYPYTAESKEDLMNRIYEDAENEESFDSQFSLRDVYPCYLNLENPKIIDCNGTPHDDVNGEGWTTRELAEEARFEGYDGVIFLNVVDPLESTDVYVAFSSNQVKDINNENPTENPDIRYSIVDEDEAMSRLAYEDALDDSYKALQEYEAYIEYGHEDSYFAQKAYMGTGFREEDIARFYDALKGEDSVPSADPVFEEDRVRRARSKEDFYNNVNAKWNDRWITEGEVLDIKSVKKDITNLVKGVMANSDTDAQYRNELVRKTLLDVRTAYQLMKQNRTDAASYLLYHSAQRMIDGVEFIRDDTAFQEYKGIRDFLRTYRINAPEEYWQNEKFRDFRKEYYGRLRIGKGNNNIESVYSDLQDRWPHLFNENEREKAGLGDAAEDLLLHIGVVIDSNVTPFMEAYSSEEAVALAFETADALYDIMAGGDRIVSLADSYKERFDAKTKAMKARHAEAILRERKIREEGIKKERDRFREFKERQKERNAHTKYFESIKDTHDQLVNRLTSNTADKHIPEQYKKELAKLLGAFDLQTVRSKNRQARTGHVAKNTIRMAAIKEALKNIENRSDIFHVNDAITDIIDSLSRVEGETLDSLSSSELHEIDRMLKALLHEFNRYEKVKIGAKNMQAADLAEAQVSSALEHAKIFGPGNDYRGPKGWMDQIINMDEMTPAYMFKRIDPDNVGLGLMWKEIRRSQDRYIRNTEQINKWVDEITGKYKNNGRFGKKYGSDEIEKWRSTNYTQTFELTNGTVQLTPAQMMSLYCLSKRNQAYGHMVGAGIVVAPVSFQAKIMSDLKKKINRSLPVILTDADIKQVVTALTPDQIKVADSLQELMSTKMADLGNEASMNVIGIKLFNESDYFPIKSDKAALEKDLTNEQFENAIRNFGFTKAVQPGARNAIMIEDIFDVVTEHCNNMNLYNSYSETLNDFMKVFNKHAIQEDGSDYSVRQALAHAYSSKSTTFIMEFIRDLNGNVSKGRTTGIETAMNETLANAKKASVFANIRVLLQQPTAITRAFAVIDPKYLKGVKIEKGAMKEMFEHCPIALWKSWGYYDINMGKSIEAIIMNEGNWLNDMATQAYGAADNVTWTAIWQMVKAEMKDTHPDVKAGTEEYWELCNERMSEIVDLTQVVDSPLHRSHAMRAKDVLHKTMTSFMAEPTLTFNMLRDGYMRAREAWIKGNKAEAGKIMGRIGSVALLQAATVAAAAAVADALRGKNKGGGDDDDEPKSLWWINFVENFKDELKLWNKVYYVKDIASIFEGWDNANLALQGWKTLADGFRQFDKKLFEGSKTPWWTIYYNLLGGVGYFAGVPVRTLMKDGRAIFEFFGGQLPESLVGEKKTSGVVDSDSALQSLRLFKQNDSKSSSTTSVVKVDASEKWYDYENNPITVRDGSPLDNFLNHFGVNLTAAEKAAIAKDQKQKERDKKAEEIGNKYADLSGEERDKKVWSAVTSYFKGEAEDSKAFADMVKDGDYGSINEMKQIYMDAGGGEEYFDSRVLAESKTALKKSIKYDQSDAEIEAQENIKDYMLSHGMSETELSEMVYKSDTAKDMKVAFRLNDKKLMLESLEPLVRAGLSYEDLEKLWDNRNRMQLSSYNGRYKDKLKSTGTFIWPADGVITSHFGYRNAPTAGASSNHPAIDIAVPVGTPVAAADGGTVIYTGRNSGYGISVGIKHDNGMVTYYNHLSGYNVNVGDTVAQGQQIASSGNTGISTGPHLDFKILDADGKPVDPEKYLNKRS